MNNPNYDSTAIPQFNNRQNEQVELVDGRVVFLARDPAICVPVSAITSDGRVFTALSRRGEGVPNFHHHYNLVCGYVDQDETIAEAAKRELWEEIGLNVDAFNKDVVLFDIVKMPWDIGDQSRSGKQNITLRYGFVFKVEDESQLPELTNKYSEESEVSEVYWESHENALNLYRDHEDRNPDIDALKEKVWAFNHFELYRTWHEGIVSPLISKV